MTDRPILFSAPMIRAILAGTKTQTRRTIKGEGLFVSSGAIDGHGVVSMTDAGIREVRCPYGQPGDRLWVRETWLTVMGEDTFYRADYAHDPAGDRAHGVAWKPSIHMPRSRSRITLEVTGVRVQRLQAISEADAVAEGIEPIGHTGPDAGPNRYSLRMGHGWANAPTAAECYRLLWETINGPGSWDADPLVWVVEFRRAPNV